MLESKKKMAQSFSDLKVALEKGKGDPKEIFSIFEQGCREFTQETKKRPPERIKPFLDLVQRMRKEIEQGDRAGLLERIEEMKRLKKICHEAYK